MFRPRSMGARIAAVALAAGFAIGGCSSTIKYTYDPVASFSGAKTYQWAPASSSSAKDALLEDNVRFSAERALEAKGWKKSEQPELVFAMSYDYEIATTDRYLVQQLTLRAARRDSGEPVWRGTAQGSIDTSASSGDLKSAVNGILSSFPPR